MFKQIVSKLSLSPSATTELAYYSRKLSREGSIRLWSAIGASLLIGLQILTLVASASPSNAASPADIIHGGFVSKTDLLSRYDQNAELKKLFAHFGILRANIAASAVHEINSRDHSLSSIRRVQHAASDGKVIVANETFWSRYLYEDDIDSRGINYQVLDGKRSSDGDYFAVMFHSGNIVFKSLSAKSAAILTINPRVDKGKPSPAEFAESKTATSLSQPGDATTKITRGGDLIRYNIAARNIGGVAGNYEFIEHLEDVLEYADVTDLGDGTLRGSILSWPKAKIAAGATVTHSFTVRIKNPIPSTPTGVSDPLSFDLRMDNVFGNDSRIVLEAPLAKQIELATSQLPRLNVTMTTIIILLVSVLIIFLYLRNRQMVAEVKMLRNDYHGGPF